MEANHNMSASPLQQPTGYGPSHCNNLIFSGQEADDDLWPLGSEDVRIHGHQGDTYLYLLTFDTFDSLTGSWSVWPHVVTPQWLIKKYIFFQYIVTALP